MAEVRPRKACSNCYEKKVKCDWPADSIICSRCITSSLVCSVPDSKAPNQRSSMRDLLFNVEQRVRDLEQGSRTNEPASSEHLSAATAASYFVPNSVASAVNASSNAYHLTARRHSSHLRPSWPWIAVRDSSYRSLAEPASESAKKKLYSLVEEESIGAQKGPQPVHFDLLREFPLLSDDLVWKYASTYAEEAPFAILSWVNMRSIIEELLQAKRCRYSGQLVCILIYLAFGSARANPEDYRYSPELFFKKAWNSLPDLFLAHDLWAFKAIILIIHWLQGAFEPNACYSLLAAASRMATSFDSNRGPHNALEDSVELEEARRAMLLCWILENSFSATYKGRLNESNLDDSSTALIYFTSYHKHSEAPRETFMSGRDEFDEEAAVEFFSMLRNLMNEINATLRKDFEGEGSKIIDFLANFFSRWQGQVEADVNLRPKLRKNIVMLAAYHAVIVLDRQLNASSGNSISAIEAAKETVLIITEYAKEGLAHCIWMWLHYLFAAAVTIFLHILADPLDDKASLYLALLSDVQVLCNGLSQPSPGTTRIAQACAEMEKIGFEMVKWHAKRKTLKRRIDHYQPDSQVSHKHPKIPHDQLTIESHETVSTSAGAQTTGLEDAFEMGIPFLGYPPTNFSWDEWDQWLQLAEGNIFQSPND